VNLIDILPLNKKNSYEYAGPCPFCGGQDRFIVWPSQERCGRYFCRQCNKSGDCIDFLRSQGVNYQQAAKELGIAINSHNTPPQPESSTIDSDLWTMAAKSLISSLAGSSEEELREMLKRKHLTNDTARKYGISWNNHDRYFPRHSWGFDFDDNKLKIPKGLVIPILRKSGIVGIKIRRSEPNTPRYWLVKGSSNECLILGRVGSPVFIVESELDAYLIHQEAGELVSVIALGGAYKELDAVAAKVISKSPQIFIATDYDEPKKDEYIGVGQKACIRIQSMFPNAIYFPPARGKDPCEMQDKGIFVKDWVRCALEN
jgi:hypothetical protein